MFDLMAPSTATAAAAAVPLPTATPWLALMLDEIDYGMLLLADGTTVLHANHAARNELDATHPLQLIGGDLRVARAQDLLPLREALLGARQRGLRRLVNLGEGAQRVSVAVVPLAAVAGDDETPRLTLLVFGKRQVCEALSAHWFARSHGLTPAEARVLAALCEGQRPSEAAAAQGVALSTVRTQIGSIRAKTGAESIRALVRQVAVLPPLVGALRSSVLH
ncbi:MAG: helix-turn-helix transcriptional regulator [Pseudomonadota bacterium]